MKQQLVFVCLVLFIANYTTLTWTYYKAEEAANSVKYGIPPWNFAPWGYR